MLCGRIGPRPVGGVGVAGGRARFLDPTAAATRPPEVASPGSTRLPSTGPAAAAVAVAELDPAARSSGSRASATSRAAVVSGADKRSMVSLGGVAGLPQARRIRTFEYPLPAGRGRHAALRRRERPAGRGRTSAVSWAVAALIAATLLRDAGIRHDDACVLVGRAGLVTSDPARAPAAADRQRDGRLRWPGSAGRTDRRARSGSTTRTRCGWPRRSASSCRELSGSPSPPSSPCPWSPRRRPALVIAATWVGQSPARRVRPSSPHVEGLAAAARLTDSRELTWRADGGSRRADQACCPPAQPPLTRGAHRRLRQACRACAGRATRWTPCGSRTRTCSTRWRT